MRTFLFFLLFFAIIQLQIEPNNGMLGQRGKGGNFGKGSKKNQKGKAKVRIPQVPALPEVDKFSLVEVSLLARIFSGLNIQQFLSYSEGDLDIIIFDEGNNYINGSFNNPPLNQTLEKLKKATYHNLHHEAYPLENIFILWNLNIFTNNLINSFLRAYRHDHTPFMDLMIYYNVGKNPLKEISIEEYLEASKRILNNAKAFKEITKNSNTLKGVNYRVLMLEEKYPAVYSQELDRKYFKFTWMAYLKDVDRGQQQTGVHSSQDGRHAGGKEGQHHIWGKDLSL
uniref:Uncharacterized protein n=1 Tax=Meloidogyne hapla TaxID=6305 RepID=A0A1I8BLX6_MELHA